MRNLRAKNSKDISYKRKKQLPFKDKGIARKSRALASFDCNLQDVCTSSKSFAIFFIPRLQFLTQKREYERACYLLQLALPSGLRALIEKDRGHIPHAILVASCINWHV